MSRQDIVMPQMGESITNGTITKWNKKLGDKVEIDEILLEISTDKVESEIPSPFEGRLVEILYPEGQTIDVGIKIAVIDSNPTAQVIQENNQADVQLTKKEVSKTTSNGDKDSGPAMKEVTEKRFYTPLVKSLAKQHGVPLEKLATIKGTGAGGRVNKEDFNRFIQTPTTNTAAQSSGSATTSISQASQRKIPLGSPSIPAQSAESSGKDEIIVMDNMRKAIAKNMVISKQTSPHVNSLSEVDLTHLVKFRESYKSKFMSQEGFNLTYTPFIIKAIVDALKKYPLVNASVDGDKIIVKKDINIGCAVAVAGNGLVVPVIHHADSYNMTGLARKINELAAKARDRKLTLAELQGGTFTFTNVGSFGTLMATPIILQPQVGIYASGVIQKRVMVMPDDSIAIRSMMYGTHTYDHRLVDGELGGKFLEAVHQNLRQMKAEELF